MVFHQNGFWSTKNVVAHDNYQQKYYLPSIENTFQNLIERKETCDLILAKSLCGIYLVKKSILSQLNEKYFSEVMSWSEFDLILMEDLKKQALLNVLVRQNYGELINMENVPNKKHPELFSFFENFNLWEGKYMNSWVNISLLFLISI